MYELWQYHVHHISSYTSYGPAVMPFTMHLGLKSEKWVLHIADEPVVIDKRGHGSISQGECVFGRLGPLNVIDTVSAVIIARDDD